MQSHALPLASAAPALAQEGKTLGTVVNGNTTTTFKAADTRDIDVAKLKTRNDFAAQHPKVAKELASKPALINDMAYSKSHPELDSFFAAHLISMKRWLRTRAITSRFRRDPANR